MLGKNFLLFQRVQLAATAKQAGGVDGRRGDEAAAKNGYHERSEKENQIKRKNGCPEPMVAADTEEAWIHPGGEDAVLKWFELLEKLNKEDEKGKMEEMHQQKVAQMIKSAQESAGLLH